MSHAYHEGLSSYNPQSILQDGCPECEDRSRRGLEGVLALDRRQQLTLWQSLVDPEVVQTSACDARLRRDLYSVRVFLEGAGISPEEVSWRWWR